MLNKTKDREHVKLEAVQLDTSDENEEKKRRIANSNYWTGTKASPKKCIKQENTRKDHFTKGTV